MRSLVDVDDVPYLLGAIGAGLVVGGLTRLSTTVALIVSGVLLMAWASWKVGGRKAGPG